MPLTRLVCGDCFLVHQNISGFCEYDKTVFDSNLKARIYQMEIKDCTISRTKNKEKKNK